MATIHDVAERAGVSPTTVSRYLNRRIELPSGTAGRIDAAIAALDYRPNRLAQRLSTGRTEAVGLVVPEIREPFFAELAGWFADEAEQHGYSVLIIPTRSDRAREIRALEGLDDRQVDGLLLMTNTPDDGTLARLIAGRRDVVILDEDVPGVAVPRLFVENTEGSYAATRHLIAAGHRDIAYIAGPTGLLTVSERRRGFERAMAEAGIPVRPELVAAGSFASESARLAVHGFFALPSPPTAIFASSDFIAMGTVTAIRELGLVLPRDISMVGFDDMPFGVLLTPPLTAVRQPVEMLGRLGFRTLLALLRGEAVPQVTRLPVQLMLRQSVGAPPPNP